MAAQPGQPPGTSNNTVKFIAMNDQQAHTVRRGVDRFLFNGDVTEYHPGMLTKNLIVVTRDEDDLGAMLGLTQYGTNHVIVCLRPVETMLHVPDINDVTHQIEVVALGAVKEVEKKISLTAPEAEMDIRDKNGTVVLRTQGMDV